MKKILTFYLICYSLNVAGQAVSRTDSIEYFKAQVKNQVAQSNYYDRQSNSLIVQLATFFGSLFAGFVALFIALRNIKNENKKIASQREIEDRKLLTAKLEEAQKIEQINLYEKIKVTRLAAADLMKKVAEGFHCLTWILWIAKNTRKDFSHQLIVDYNQKMNIIYSEISGFQVILAGHNKSLYEATEPLQQRLYKDDASANRLIDSIVNYKSDDPAIIALGEIWQDVYDFGNQLPKDVAKLLDQIAPLP